MKTWQKNWLYILIVLASIHYIRDTLQDLEIQNFLTSAFVKTGHSMVTQNNAFPIRVYWSIFNTYTIAVVEITLSIVCLKRYKFGELGYSTIVIAISSLVLGMFSWFFLK